MIILGTLCRGGRTIRRFVLLGLLTTPVVSACSWLPPSSSLYAELRRRIESGTGGSILFVADLDEKRPIVPELEALFRDGFHGNFGISEGAPHVSCSGYDLPLGVSEIYLVKTGYSLLFDKHTYAISLTVDENCFLIAAEGRAGLPISL